MHFVKHVPFHKQDKPYIYISIFKLFTFFFFFEISNVQSIMWILKTLTLTLTGVLDHGRSIEVRDSYTSEMEATQSSTYKNYNAGRAVDGDGNSLFGDGSCSQTRKDNRPWWMVDLRQNTHVTLVVITTRAGGSCELLFVLLCIIN
jgi:hypothetical protein